MIKISAPGKLMLFGEHAVVHGRPCIVTAVDQRISVSLSKRKDNKIYLNTPDMKIKKFVLSIDELNKPQSKETRFVLNAVKNFFEKYNLQSGLNIKTKSDPFIKFGLGSSSAVTVSIIKGLAELFEMKINNKELFNLSYKTVLDIQEVGSGFDVAAAIYGGTLFFVRSGEVIEQLEVEKPPIILGYTGIKADTPTLVKMVSQKLQEEPRKVNKIFDEIEKTVNLARIEMEKSNWGKVGGLMNLNQSLLRKLGVSSNELENLITAALDSGAYGAKLSGAGGGDCMIAIADEEKLNNVKEAVEKAGGKIVDAKPQTDGVRLG